MTLLSGCGSNSKESSERNSDQANAEAETRIYTDTTGREVEIPNKPKRVVTTYYLDAMIALGEKPVGASTHVLDNNHLGEKQEGVADVGTPVNIEKVLEVNPDLMITMNPDEVEQLSKIAPTVVIEFHAFDVYG